MKYDQVVRIVPKWKNKEIGEKRYMEAVRKFRASEKDSKEQDEAW